jgi:hypothetical protein
MVLVDNPSGTASEICVVFECHRDEVESLQIRENDVLV